MVALQVDDVAEGRNLEPESVCDTGDHQLCGAVAQERTSKVEP